MAKKKPGSVVIGPFTITRQQERKHTMLEAPSMQGAGMCIIPLEGREAELLSILADHPNEWVSKQDILMTIWGGMLKNPRHINAFASNLRTKMTGALPLTAIPYGMHYFVSNGNGHYGLFRSLHPMAGKLERRGPHSGVGSALQAMVRTNLS